MSAELEVLQRGASIGDALAFYDRMAPIDSAFMEGKWEGSGLPTGNPLDGLLERTGWYGKNFSGTDNADPLVMRKKSGSFFLLNPRMVPLQSIVRRTLLQRPGVQRSRSARAGRPLALVRTTTWSSATD